MASDKTSIGDRMKSSYENITRVYLPRRTYTILRLDGCHFHTWTKGLDKPFDNRVIKSMQNTAYYLMREIQGAKLAYTQSDEISILLTDFDDINTEAWFGGNVQKMCSVAASMASNYFNAAVDEFIGIYRSDALFDCRVFTIPEPVEVLNYFIWRHRDCERNSIQSAGQAYFSHTELMNKSGKEVQEMLYQAKGINWAVYYPNEFKNGTFYWREDGIIEESSNNLKDQDFRSAIKRKIPISHNAAFDAEYQKA